MGKLSDLRDVDKVLGPVRIVYNPELERRQALIDLGIIAPHPSLPPEPEPDLEKMERKRQEESNRVFSKIR